MISDFSSRTSNAWLADSYPSFPLRNLPGPNTEQVAELRMAHNSKPIAAAVTDKNAICKTWGVSFGNSYLRAPKANPAIIAAIPDIPL